MQIDSSKGDIVKLKLGKSTCGVKRPVDAAAKLFIGQPDVSADLCNLCFSRYSNGINRILPQHLTRLDPSHYNVIMNDDGVIRTDNRFRDLLFKCSLPQCEGECIYIGMELQTRYDSTMLERCGRYDLQFYIEQKNDIAGRGGKEWKPIINIVLNLSCTHWEGSHSLFRNPEKWPKELMAFCPNYFVNVFDIISLAKKSAQVTCDEFRFVLNCFRYRRSKSKLDEIIKTGMPDGICSVNAAILVNVCLGLKLRLTEEAGKVNMCKAMQDYTLECEKRGEKIGEKRGKEIGEKRGKEIGEKRGKEIGEKIGREQTLMNIITLMLSKNMPVSDIRGFTGSTNTTIRKIAKEKGLAIHQ